MSIDRFHYVTNETTTDITREEVAKLAEIQPEANSVYIMRAGVEHLFIFEDGAQAAEFFERYRREPCENIRLTLEGVAQDWVGRLPLGTKPGDGCDMDVSWDGCYDTGGDPNGPAQWKVRCGQPVAGGVEGRPFCNKHLGGDSKRDLDDGFSVQHRSR